MSMHDTVGRLVAESTPSNGTIQYEYNALNLQAELTNARGQETTFTYDLAEESQHIHPQKELEVIPMMPQETSHALPKAPKQEPWCMMQTTI